MHSSSLDVRIVTVTGDKVKTLIPQIAALRIEVFREYPFLYIGDLKYEERYLKKFTTLKDAVVVLAFDKETLIGVSTGFPFIYDAENLKEVFLKAGRKPDDYFCFGESVLRKSYRGLGIGKKFFDEREAHVKALNHYKNICFYTVARPADDRERPSDYRPLAPFWKSRGFVEYKDLIGSVSYQEIGESEETPKKMLFWIKNLTEC